MAKLAWDKTGERRFETGVDHGVLYIPNNLGQYNNGYAWNGLTGVTESPSGAESNPQYADNIKYLNLQSAEQFGATIEAFTYPEEFEQCDGSASPQQGISVGQQGRRTFGLAYRTRVGNDLLGTDYGYKIHLIYGANASPSERAYSTVNDSPEAINFSWELATSPVEVGTVSGVSYKPTASVTIDSTKVDASALADLEDILYGTASTDPRLPQPSEVFALFSGTVTEVSPTEPSYNSTTHVITIPTVAGVTYEIDGVPVTGTVTITEDTIVTARVNPGYKFAPNVDVDWGYDYV